MAYNFLPVERDQSFLLPPSMRDWLPEDHLAFFMLDDPPTSPVKYRDQAVFGVLVAVAAFAGFEAFGWLYYMLAGLLIGNAWWAALRTYRSRTRRSGASPAGEGRPVHATLQATADRRL